MVYVKFFLFLNFLHVDLYSRYSLCDKSKLLFVVLFGLFSCHIVLYEYTKIYLSILTVDEQFG